MISKEKFIENIPVMVKDLGEWWEPEPNDSETFSLDRDKWLKEFKDGYGKKGKNKSVELYSSGVYCFWWKGTKKELEEYKQYHYVQGQECDPEDTRFIGSDVKCLKTGDRETTKKKVKTIRPVYHAFYPLEWQFHEVPIGEKTYVPLYIGKATQVYKRVSQHLKWPNREKPVNHVHGKLDLPMAKKPKGNTVAQFRAGFEFLTKNISTHKARRKLFENKIALSFNKMDFIDFQERFYTEDLLIGHLRPPFNVDSER